MNNEETKILNPVQQEEPKKETVVENEKPMGKGDKMKYAGGGFAAGMVAGAATSAGAASLSKNDVHGEEQPIVTDETSAVETESVVQPVESVQTETQVPDVEVQHPTPNPEETLVATDEGIRVAQVDDDASFSQAFADARAQVGPGGAFEWQGKVYSTYTKEEWDNMSAEERAEYQSKIDYNDITGGQTESASATTIRQETTIDANVTEQQEEAVAANAQMVDESATSGEVTVLGVEAVVDEQGNPMTAAVVEMDGQQALLLDVDNSGTMDVIIADFNGDGEITQDEMADFSGANVTVDDLQAHMMADQQDQSYMACNDDMPDYMNDADVSMMA